MKSRRYTALITAVLMAFVMLLAACGSSEPEEPLTLENYLKDNPDVQSEIDEQLAQANTEGLSIDVSGNEVIYTYDVSKMDGMTEEWAKSDDVKELLEGGLSSQTDNFKNVANQLAQTTEIEGIKLVVNYTYGDEVIASASYEADPLPADEDSEKDAED